MMIDIGGGEGDCISSYSTTANCTRVLINYGTPTTANINIYARINTSIIIYNDNMI